MKIKTNFIDGISSWLLPVFLLTGSGILLLGAVLFWLQWNTAVLKADLPQVTEKLPELERLIAAAGKQEMPAPAQLREMQVRVAGLNAIPQGRGLSSLQILAKLEALLPDQVVLTAVHHRAKEREVLLLAQANTTEALSQFLLKLERDDQLEAVVLAQQKEVEQSGKSVVQFEIRFKVRA